MNEITIWHVLTLAFMGISMMQVWSQSMLHATHRKLLGIVQSDLKFRREQDERFAELIKDFKAELNKPANVETRTMTGGFDMIVDTRNATKEDTKE